ncbi:MAG: NrfD/PsrC family molybdoenzyme membrane anchor subunit [Nitrospiria bacterium]
MKKKNTPNIQSEFQKLDQAVIKSMTHTSGRYWLLVGFLGLMVAAAIAAFMTQVRDGLSVTGLNQPVYWGVYILTFVFWIGLSHAGTLLSAVLYLTKSHWRKPIYRAAEIMTLFSLVNAGLLPIIHLGRPWFFYWVFPPYPNQRQLWPNLRSPLAWDSIAINSYLVGSALFLFVGLIPDMATLRDHATGWRKYFYTVFALGWRGGDEQWHHFKRAYAMMAAFIIPLMVLVSSIVGWDFSITNMHGLHSAIFAPFFVLGALYSGVSAVITLSIFIRKQFHFEDYIKIEHLEKLAIFLIVLSLLWIYFMSTETFVFWQTKDQVEIALIFSKISGPFSGLYWFMIVVLGGLPFTFLWKKVRTSIPALLTISILINIAMWIERYLILVPSLSISDAPFSWGTYIPTLTGMTIIAGTFAFFGLNFLLFIKLFPVVSMYEIKEMFSTKQEEA